MKTHKVVPCILTERGANIVVDGHMKTFAKSHFNYSRVVGLVNKINRLIAANPTSVLGMLMDPIRRQRIENLYAKLRRAADMPSHVNQLTAGRITVNEDVMLYDGMPVHNTATEKLIELFRFGQDIQPLLKFIDNLMQNPTIDVRDDLFKWLSKGKMPLTEDGCFLGYKKVRADYRSEHANPDGSYLDNSIGSEPSMPREDCDDQRDRTCSRGLHFCSYEYLPHFGWGQGHRVVILKIDPRNVVAIPTDYNLTKGRACKYKVIGELPEDEAAQFFHERPVVKGEGETPFESAEPTGDDWNEDDDHWADDPRDADVDDGDIPGTGDDDDDGERPILH